jgi:hypothetical protein
MKWVLVIWLINSNNVASIEFENSEACNHARKTMSDELGSGWFKGMWCFQKSKGNEPAPSSRPQ